MRFVLKIQTIGDNTGWIKILDRIVIYKAIVSNVNIDIPYVTSDIR